MKNLINFYIKKNHKLNKIFLNKNKRVNFIFGGHVFSQFLFATGLKEKKFNCILDNSNLKNNQRLYGYKIQIQKPEIIKKIDEPLVLINVGQYKNEIISQLKKINKNVKLIFI